MAGRLGGFSLKQGRSVRFSSCTHEESISSARGASPGSRGYGGMLPQKMLKFGVPEMPFPAFFGGHLRSEKQ